MGFVKWRSKGALCFDLDPCDFCNQEDHELFCRHEKVGTILMAATPFFKAFFILWFRHSNS